MRRGREMCLVDWSVTGKEFCRSMYAEGARGKWKKEKDRVALIEDQVRKCKVTGKVTRCWLI